MADNFTANPGAGGKTFASDEIGGVDHPYAKMEWGPNDTATPVAVGASALPVQDGGNSLTIDTPAVVTENAVAPTDTDGVQLVGIRADNPFAVTRTDADGDYTGLTCNAHGHLYVVPQGSTLAFVNGGPVYITILDTADTIVKPGDATNNAVRVNVVAGSVDTELPAAVALADNTANPTVPAVGAFTMVWDGTTWDRAPGTSTDGILVNLGANNDVTVTGSVTVVDGGGSLTVDGTVGISGTVPVSDGGGSLTVDGTITANAGTNLNTSALALEAGGNLAGAATSLAVIDDWDESDRAKVNPIVGQAGVQGGSGAVSATTQRVVLATDVSLPPGTNNIGDVDVLTVPASTKTIKRAVGNPSTSGNNTAIAAPGVGKVIKVISYALQAQGTVNAKFTDGAGGSDLTMLWNFQVREGVFAQPTEIPQFHFKCTSNTALVLNLSAAVVTGFEITYWDDDAS